MALQAKLRKTLRVFLSSGAALILILAAFTVSLNILRHRDGQDFLNALRLLKVGVTTGSEASRYLQTFKPDTYILKHTELPSGSSDQWVDVSPKECISANCTLSFGADAHTHWLTRLWYPLWNWPGLRRWVPVSGLYADVTVEHGIVRDVFVEMESIQEEEVQTARVEVTSKQLQSEWNIRRYTAFNTGGPGRTSPTVELTFSPRSVHPNQGAALDFNLGCLRIGRACSRCDIQPFICEDYDHGDWFFFEMRGNLLKSFQSTVNGLAMGTSEDAITNRVGWGALGSQRLFDDKLPYRFPVGTMFGDHNPTRLIYYVKKWREQSENPKDQTVTFVLDPQDRVVAIRSKVEGVLSRP